MDYSSLSSLTGISNQNTVYKTAQRLIKKRVITPLCPGHFLVSGINHISEFEIANFVHQPSYISLHSALSFYGILSQFVYSVTSITTRKTKKLMIAEKEYVYSHVNQNHFWGYEKSNGMLIATPEKALVDTLYFKIKGIVSLNLEELDYSRINYPKLKQVAKQFYHPQLIQLVKEIDT